MKVVLTFLLWCLLFVLCWPVAVLALLAAPVVWLLAWPFRLAGTCVQALFEFIKAILFLPARILGQRPA